MLNIDTLKSGILDMLNGADDATGQPDPYEYQAYAMAVAIDDYFKEVVDILGNGLTLTDIETLKNDLRVVFTNAIKPENQNAIYAATQISNAISTYIELAIFSFATVPPEGIIGSGTSNLVTSVAIPALLALQTTFLSVSSSVGYDAEVDRQSKAQELANAIHLTCSSTLLSISYFLPGTPPVPATMPLTVL